MIPLTDTQRDELTDFLSRKKCDNCGSTDWEFDEIEIDAAQLDVSSQKLTPNSGAFVDVTCRSCGEHDSVDCAQAGLTDYY